LSVKTPLLIVFSENDEYGDRPANEIEAWFKKQNTKGNISTFMLKDAGHSLIDVSSEINSAIDNWLDFIK